MNVKYLGSSVSGKDVRDYGKCEIALAGRSNVGKSSLLNALAGAGVARTSKTPGRTRMVNYFDFGEFVLVDLPGYGFAKASATEQAKWQDMIEGYFFGSKRLVHTCVLVDSRLEAQTSDKQMVDFLFKTNKSFTIVATKIDKIPKSKRFHRLKEIAAGFKVGSENVIGTSSDEKLGLDVLLLRINQFVEGKDETV